MKISVRCFARLACLQPDPPEMDLPLGARVSDALGRLGLPLGAEAVVLLDGGPAGPDTPLSPGASLEVLPLVDGG